MIHQLLMSAKPNTRILVTMTSSVVLVLLRPALTRSVNSENVLAECKRCVVVQQPHVEENLKELNLLQNVQLKNHKRQVDKIRSLLELFVFLREKDERRR